MKVFACMGYLLVMALIARKVEAMTEVEKSIIGAKVFLFALECIQSYPLTGAEIISFGHQIFPDGQNTKCFAACVFKKIGIMDENGMLSPEGARNKAELLFKGNEAQLRKVDELMKTCSFVNEFEKECDQKGCDRAKSLYECLIENGPKYELDVDV